MTIVEVAERAGVSLGTVSRVMNNDIHVAPDTRERVVAVMREMGYVANLVKGMLDGLMLILPRNPADNMGILKNANFPFVLIDHQGTGSLCLAVGAQYAKPGEEPGGVDYAGYRLPVCALGDAGGELALAESKFYPAVRQGAVLRRRSASIVNNRLSVTWQEVQPVH